MFTVNSAYQLEKIKKLKLDFNVKYVPIVDVAIGSELKKNSEPRDLGLYYDIFCRSPDRGQLY